MATTFKDALAAHFALKATVESYTDCERPYTCRDYYLNLLRRYHKQCGTYCEKAQKPDLSPEILKLIGQDWDETKWDDIADEVTIYRGADEIETGQWGISWTLDEKEARAFPFKSRHVANSPILLTATVRKEEAFAFIFSRNEKEVLVDPDRLVDVEVERLEKAT